jgi:tetratricopeptide (TPR) repeat protein
MFGGRWRSWCSGWLAAGWLVVACAAADAQGRESALPKSAVDLQRLAAWLAPRQSPAEQALLASAANRNWGAGSVLRAALAAEGLDAKSADVYASHVDAWARELNGLSGHPSVRAAAALALLHQRVLKHYDAHASSLAGALDEGRYNCLGATILFAALAERLNLQCRAVERPGHVLVRLKLDQRSLDIETTCPPGFDLPQTPGPVQADERELSNSALLGLVYFNRGCDLLQRQAFRGALGANLLALQLDPDNTRACNNLLAAWNNWALTLARQGELRAAGELLAQGLELAPEYPLFADNLHAIGTIATQSARIKNAGSID